MAKNTKPATKPTKKTEEAHLQKTPRRLKTLPRKAWQLPKRVKYDGPKLPNSWKIFRSSLGVIKRNKRLFGGILLVYTILSLILVRGFSSTAQLDSLKATLQQAHGSTFNIGTNLLGSLFGSSTQGQAGASAYQSILFVLLSLVVIWALRQVYDKPKTAAVKTAFYQSSYPMVQFVLVLMAVSLQLIPLLAGATIYGLVLSNSLAANGLETLAWATGFFALALVSFYMIASSLFALYIVTLPNVTPVQALRSAKQLVQGRRWVVMRKILFLPLVLFVLTCLIMLPAVLWLTAIAEWIFFVLSLASLIVNHSYLYSLYRELM